MKNLYLHLGKKVEVKTTDIIGVFDLDTASLQKGTREFLERVQKEGKVINVSEELPKSFTLVQQDGKEKVYVGPLMVSTLMSRLGIPQLTILESNQNEN